jgi:hypothetical protein
MIDNIGDNKRPNKDILLLIDTVYGIVVKNIIIYKRYFLIKLSLLLINSFENIIINDTK